MENSAALFEKILTHYEKKEYEIADKLLDGILDSQPNFHRAWFLKGVILEERGKPDKAQKYYQKAGNCFTLWFRLALQLEDVDPVRAMAYLDRVSSMDPKNNMVWLTRGLLLEKLGRLDEAHASYRNLEPLREILSRIMIPSGFMIFLLAGAVMMLRRGEKGLAIIVMASAVFCLFWLRRDGGNAIKMLSKKKGSKLTIPRA